MLDYVIHRLTYTEAKKDTLMWSLKRGICQHLCILDSGKVRMWATWRGSFENINTINIQYMQLMPAFLA